MQYVIGLLVVGFVIISVMMMLVVLIQRPTGGGLSGAFGSASEGAGQTAFGAKTGDALTTATIVIFLLFLGFAIGLNYVVEAPSATPTPQATSDPVPAQEAPGTPGAMETPGEGGGTSEEGVFSGTGASGEGSGAGGGAESSDAGGGG